MPTWTKKNVHETSRCLVPDRSAGLVDLSRCRDRARILHMGGTSGRLHDICPGLANMFAHAARMISDVAQSHIGGIVLCHSVIDSWW